jgi:acyl-CoA thioesterase-1
VKTKTLLILLCGICYLAPACAAEVVALGASNTEGAGGRGHPDGVSVEQAYPAQLERMLHMQNCNITVQNAGQRGDTTAGMLSRLPGVLSSDTRVLILQPGGNDARDGVDVDDTSRNVGAIRAYVQSRGIRLVTLTRLGQIAGTAHRQPDGQHFDEQGHILFAKYLLPRVKSTGVCVK